MLFWLTFIRSLPAVQVPSLPTPRITATNAQTTSTKLMAHNPHVLAQSVPLHPTFPAQLGGGLLVFPGLIAGLIFLLLISVWAYTRVYVITPNNEAFVRTGGIFAKRKTVILNGGCIVLPGFHELTRVPLREISIDVERTGKLAVRTQDYLRADMRVTFYVCINPTEEDVLTAAARLSQNNRITSEDIKNALEKRADDAIRAAAKNKNQFG